MRYLYKFYESCGRMGDLEGIFVADEADVALLLGKTLYFGEVLGKYSDITVEIDEKSITKQELDSETVEKVSKILGETWSGFNPVDKYKEWLEENSDD